MPQYKVVRTSDGRVVRVPVDASPDELRKAGIPRSRARSFNPAGRGEVRREVSPEEQEVQRRLKKATAPGAGTALARGFTSNFLDEGLGLLTGAGRYIASGGDMEAAKREYRITKATEEALARRYNQENPILNPVLETAGAFASPIGTGARFLKGAGAGLKAVGGTRAAQALGNAAQALQKSPILGGMAAGFNQGALNALGISNREDWSDYVNDAAAGGVFGLGFGALGAGASHLIGRGLNAVRGARASNAPEIAKERVAGLIAAGNKTPEQIERSMRYKKAIGGDPILADELPSLRGEAAAISRRTSVPSGNKLIERAEGRIEARRSRFTNKALEEADTPANFKDSLERRLEIRDALKAEGALGYAEGGLMDTPIPWTKELQEFFDTSPDLAKFMPRAIDDALRHGDDIAVTNGLKQIEDLYRGAPENTQVIPIPRDVGTGQRPIPYPGLPGTQAVPPGAKSFGRTQGGMPGQGPVGLGPDGKPFIGPGTPGGVGGGTALSGNPVVGANKRFVPGGAAPTPGPQGKGPYDSLPTMRVFDYLKRQYDDAIGAAMSRGEDSLAKGLSNSLVRLRNVLGEAAPQYKELLSRQRDMYQQKSAVEKGEQFWRHLTGGRSQQLLHDLKNMKSDDLNEWRIGALDYMVRFMGEKANPVVTFRNAMYSPEQRKVMSIVFGGEKNARRFNRWLRREINANETDRMLGTKGTSDTMRIFAAANDPDGGLSHLTWNALKGYAFGRSAGAASNLATGIRNIVLGTPLNKASQEQIAQMLLSNGEGLADTLRVAGQAAAKRTARQTAVSQAAGKTAGYNASKNAFGGP